MTVNETIEVLKILRAGMPGAFLRLTEADAAAMVSLWADMFQDFPAEAVLAGVQTYLWRDTGGRFPSPGAIRQCMQEVAEATTQIRPGLTIREALGKDTDRFPQSARRYIMRTAAEHRAKLAAGRAPARISHGTRTQAR